MKHMTPRQLASKGMRPSPVYEAHFSDSTVLRLSFWNESGKPYAIESARDLFKPGVPMILHGYDGYDKDGNRTPITVTLPAHLEGKTLVAGFVEHDVPGKPWVRFADPYFTGEAAPVPATRAKRPTIKQAREVVRDLLWAAQYDLRPIDDCGPSKQDAVQRARDLLAA